jgi:amino acid transporter
MTTESVVNEGGKTKGASPGGLRPNALGLVGAAAFGAVMLSPALGIYGNFAALESTSGVVTSLVFLIALAIALPSAVSYAVVAKEMPAAGSAYTWLWRVTRPRVGSWVGWLMATYYMVVVFLQPVIFGLFFNELLSYFGIHPNHVTYGLGVLLATAIVVPAVYGNVTKTARAAIFFLLFEVLTITALSVTIFIVQGAHGHLSADPINPAAATGGFGGIARGVLFGILAFTGFDVVSTIAEETKTPKSRIPIATVGSLILVGFFWVFGSWAFSIAVSPSQVSEFAAQGITPITPIATIFWHKASVIVTITGLTASLGCYLGGMTTLGRVIFAMGRDGAAPRQLARLHPKHQTPWNALHLGFAIVLVVTGLIGSLVSDPYSVFIWSGEATVFFAVITYFFVNLGNFIYYRRYRRANFNWFLNGFVPFAGMAVLAYALYKAFFVALWGAGFALGRSVIYFAVGWAILGAAYTWWLSKRRPEIFQRESFVLESSGDADDEGVAHVS